MRNYLLLLLFVIASLMPISQTELYAQDPSNDNVTLVVSGEGTTKDEATKNALRSAIEQAFGTFVSANTTVLNDEIVSDEIVSVASGNIQNYKEISITDIEGGKMVSLQATVSIGKLVSFAQNKGMASELAGATFLMNKKMRDLNEQNEIKALSNLYIQLCGIAATGLYDYKLELKDPKESENNTTEIPFTIDIVSNENMNRFFDCLLNNLSYIKLSANEIAEYESANRKTYSLLRGFIGAYVKQYKFRSAQSTQILSDITDLLDLCAGYGFSVTDNLGNVFANDRKEYRSKDKKLKMKKNRKYYEPLDYKLLGQSNCVFISNVNGSLFYSDEEMEKLKEITVNPIPVSAWTIYRYVNVYTYNNLVQSNKYNETLKNHISSRVQDGSLLTFDSCGEPFCTFEINLDKDSEVSPVVIYNGAQKSQESYYNYARIQHYSVVLYDWDTKLLEISHGKLEDTPEPQIIINSDAIEKLKAVKTEHKKIGMLYVHSLYQGKKWNSWAITDLISVREGNLGRTGFAKDVSTTIMQ